VCLSFEPIGGNMFGLGGTVLAYIVLVNSLNIGVTDYFPNDFRLGYFIVVSPTRASLYFGMCIFIHEHLYFYMEIRLPIIL